MRCDCFDSGCPAGHGSTSRILKDSQCPQEATLRLYRSDFADNPVVEFCEACAEDALASGLFGVEEDSNG